MAFATNSSAFGMNKPATTATTSIFGQPNTAKPAGSLFGNTQTTGTGFGAFGTNTQTQNQPATLQPPANPTTQQQSPFVPFGTSTQTQNQPSTLQPQNPPAQQQNAFGGFGSFGMNTNPAQPATGGWGSTTSQAQSTLQVPTINTGFGTSTAAPALFNQQRQPSAMGISPVQQQATALFSKTTKFNDLPDEVKRTLETIDNHIQGRVQISNELKRLKLGEEAIKGQDLIRDIHKDLLNVTSSIQGDSLFTRDLKHKTEQAVQDTITATRIIDGFKNPQQNAAYLKNHATFPLEFFNRVTQQMKERLQWYKNTIEQIERRLSSAASQVQSTPQAISTTLQAQHATFISLASKTAAVDAELQKVKELYTKVWRAKTGSMRDPFNDLDRNTGADFGMDSLYVR